MLSGEVAFDTEFVSEFTYRPELCLLQFATRERAAAEQAYAPLPEPSYAEAPAMQPFGAPYPAPQASGIVTALEIPFGRLVAFFLKAVFAAIPAIILLGIFLWCAGQILTNYFPWLLKMKILITFPN